MAAIFIAAPYEGIDDRLSFIWRREVACLLAGRITRAQFDAVHGVFAALVIEAAFPGCAAVLYVAGHVVWRLTVVSADKE